MSAIGYRVQAVVVALMLLLGGSAQATSVHLIFGPPDFEWYHSSGNASPNHISVAGDFWAQTFYDTGLGSADFLAINLFIDGNTLFDDARLDLAILLNDDRVGGFSIVPGLDGAMTFDFYFAPVAGPDYRVEIMATNTIPDGYGSVSMAADGRSSVVLEGATVPLPGALPLLSLGLVGLAACKRRRRSADVVTG